MDGLSHLPERRRVPTSVYWGLENKAHATYIEGISLEMPVFISIPARSVKMAKRMVPPRKCLHT
jgi:hypothetical protein|nr:hypothetical protein Q903MT_gene939 [Picea sitchensis]